MSVRLAINPITWVNDDLPSLGAGTSLDTILSETRQAGFAGTEMSFQFPKTSAELGPLLKKYNLVLTSGWYDGRILERDIDAEWAAILPHMTLLKDLGNALGLAGQENPVGNRRLAQRFQRFGVLHKDGASTGGGQGPDQIRGRIARIHGCRDGAIGHDAQVGQVEFQPGFRVERHHVAPADPQGAQAGGDLLGGLFVLFPGVDRVIAAGWLAERRG